MAKAGQTEEIDFYCLNCGKSYPLQRSKSCRRELDHRKKLYCPWCKKEVNHIAVIGLEAKEQFKKDFENGLFKEEAQDSIDFIIKEGGIFNGLHHI